MSKAQSWISGDGGIYDEAHFKAGKTLVASIEEGQDESGWLDRPELKVYGNYYLSEAEALEFAHWIIKWFSSSE